MPENFFQELDDLLRFYHYLNEKARAKALEFRSPGLEIEEFIEKIRRIKAESETTAQAFRLVGEQSVWERLLAVASLYESIVRAGGPGGTPPGSSPGGQTSPPPSE